LLLLPDTEDPADCGCALVSAAAARTCSGRSKRLMARIRSLEVYAQERMEAGDEESARNTLQVGSSEV
jgi:hypothetical protein